MKIDMQGFLPSGLLKVWILAFIFLIPLNLQSYGADGAISGRVTDESSNGLSNVEVRIHMPGQTIPISSIHTDIDGYYTVSDLAPGTYKVLFTGETGSGPAGYVWEYYNNKYAFSEADLVTVTDGATTSDIDAEIAALPTDIYEPNNDFGTAYTVTSGTYDNIVIDSEEGDPEWFKIYLEEGQDLRVATLNTLQVFPDPTLDLDIDLHIYDSAGNRLAEAISSRATETLYLSNVTAGWYYIWIQYAPWSVLSLSVTTGDLGIGEITGHITNSLGAGVQNVKAGFYAWDNLDWSLFYANVLTDASGNYKFAFVPGSYRLYFDTSEALDPYVLGEWYNDQSNSMASAIVTISGGQTVSGIDAQLPDGAAFSGQVTDLGSNPLSSVTIRASDPQGKLYALTTLTDTNGNYIYGHIPLGEGSTKVRFSKGTYGTEWWNDKPNFGLSESVTLELRQTTTGINAQLVPHGRITGRVTDSLGNGIQNVRVLAYDPIQKTFPAQGAWTNATGNFTIGQLSTMNVRILFGTDRSSPYNSEYYADKVTYETADEVAVTAGSTMSNINAQLSNRSLTIREPDGGENWCGGSAHTLWWDNTGTIANMKIEYSLDNGVNFTTETPSTPNTGNYRWIVPAFSSSSCVVRISDASNPADYDDSNFNITISAGKCQVPSDFNMDGISDATVWRPSNGIWYSILNYGTGDFSAIPWGMETDVAVAGDYDDDAQSDIAVWRPDTGVWYALLSGTPGSYTNTQWGMNTDIPTPGDYDGDGKTDPAVFRPGSGTWYILLSGTQGSYTAVDWGMASDVPVPADYDGDGKVDIAVWRPGSGDWYILPSAASGTYISTQWGISSDIPVPADYDGDFKTDIAVWRPDSGDWYLLPSASLPGIYTTTQWGMTGDQPAVADYDGDGKMDFGIWRPDSGTWFVLLSTGGYGSVQWGAPNDKPITFLTPILNAVP